MINLQKVFALMGIHNLTSVFLRIINRKPEHPGLSVGFFSSHFTWSDNFFKSETFSEEDWNDKQRFYLNLTIPKTGKHGLTF